MQYTFGSFVLPDNYLNTYFIVDSIFANISQINCQHIAIVVFFIAFWMKCIYQQIKYKLHYNTFHYIYWCVLHCCQLILLLFLTCCCSSSIGWSCQKSTVVYYSTAHLQNTFQSQFYRQACAYLFTLRLWTKRCQLWKKGDNLNVQSFIEKYCSQEISLSGARNVWRLLLIWIQKIRVTSKEIAAMSLIELLFFLVCCSFSRCWFLGYFLILCDSPSNILADGSIRASALLRLCSLPI